MTEIENNFINKEVEKILINELREKTRYNIFSNNDIKKITNNNLSTINLLFETEETIICFYINYTDIKNTTTELTMFINSVKEINKLDKLKKKCYGIYLSKNEPITSCKSLFNKENANLTKNGIKFITLYNINNDANNLNNLNNTIRRLQLKLHMLGIFYSEPDGTIIMST